MLPSLPHVTAGSQAQGWQFITLSAEETCILNVFLVTLKDPISDNMRHIQNLLKQITDWN